MTPTLTVNLLRVLFVTFCGAIGGIVTAETQGNYLPGILVGLVFGLMRCGPLGSRLVTVHILNTMPRIQWRQDIALMIIGRS